jgi:hypothetical protein
MIKFKTQTEYTCEMRLYVGSREGYHGTEFTEDKLVESIGTFQTQHNEFTPVRVTKTRYVDRDYNEPGWELGVVCYPRHPRTKAQLQRFMTDLAVWLLEDMKQNRITLVTNEDTTMFEIEK